MKRIATFVVLSCLLAWPSIAIAQQQPATGAAASESSQLLLGSDAMVGSPVRGPDGRDIGKVTRLMIEPGSGRVVTVVVSTGATFGLGGHTVSVPWSSVKVGHDDGRVIVTLSQMLDTAPKAERDRPKESAPSASPPTAPAPSQPAPSQPR